LAHTFGGMNETSKYNTTLCTTRLEMLEQRVALLEQRKNMMARPKTVGSTAKDAATRLAVAGLIALFSRGVSRLWHADWSSIGP